jgi:16S rRNA C967 or C1407 C5-methylase (RsmB/RsmF family)
LKQLQQYLVKAGNSGFLTRQELVSMLPPLLLDLQKDDLVLDVCAAPGSKTVQMLELINYQQNNGVFDSKGGIIANDVEFKRAYILAHQLQRLNLPGYAVINHAGQFLPSVYQQETNEEGKLVSNKKQPFLYDKVLVDAPCSGDGAIRKLPMRWKMWKPVDGMHLHALQIKILQRSINLAKPGALIVYSTCSMNPIEDEAVVAETMRNFNKQTKGYLELLDIHSKFPSLIMSKGISEWYVK